ncbi:hypothetical protein Lal_00036266 [Lupinus albus]|nr:hypothetical protein Lal_00036266 [Lupinus albus]
MVSHIFEKRSIHPKQVREEEEDEIVGFSLKRAHSRSSEENPAHFKNSDLTLSLKRGILAQARISQSQQSQNIISRSGETTLAQARILQYSPRFHPPSHDHTLSSTLYTIDYHTRSLDANYIYPEEQD